MALIPSIGEITFDEKQVPTGFCWSGNCSSVYSFKKANFLPVEKNGHHILICSDSNSVALGDYLAEYIDQSQRFSRTASFMNDDIDYWCYLAWEFIIPSYADLPGWVQDGIQVAFGEKIVFQDEWIFLIDTDELEGKPLFRAKQRELNDICREAVLEELRYRFEDAESVDIWAHCHTVNSGSISFGCPLDKADDGSWIYEGVADALYENYEEFEETVMQAADEGYAVLQTNPDEDLHDLAYWMIKKALGKITVVYEVDEKEVDIEFDVDIPDLTCSYLADYVETNIKYRA